MSNKQLAVSGEHYLKQSSCAATSSNQLQRSQNPPHSPETCPSPSRCRISFWRWRSEEIVSDVKVPTAMESDAMTCQKQMNSVTNSIHYRAIWVGDNSIGRWSKSHLSTKSRRVKPCNPQNHIACTQGAQFEAMLKEKKVSNNLTLPQTGYPTPSTGSWSFSPSDQQD